MKRKISPGSAARKLGKFILAITLVFAAIAIGFGGTAFFIFHQSGGSHELSGKQAKAGIRSVTADRKDSRTPARARMDVASDVDARSQVRPVAASSTDRATYTYADNRFETSDAPRGRDRSAAAGSRATTVIPAPLTDLATAVNDVAPSPGTSARQATLSDPESRFIVDSRTGRVIGIDGSAGADAEARQQDTLQQQQVTVRTAMAVNPAQTPLPEVRLATPVLVKRATPLTAEPIGTSFSASDELAQDDTTRPVLRAQAVLPPGARVVKTVRIYRLPDGSQAAMQN